MQLLGRKLRNRQHLVRAVRLSCALAAGSVLAGGSASAQATYPPPPAVISMEILANISGLDGTSVSVAVSQGAKVEWAGGFGSADVATEIPATAQTVYQIGSVTKTFTAALVMRLVQAGKLELSDYVGQFVGGLPWGQKVTIAELLSHTSGIVDYVNSRPSMLGVHCPTPSGSVASCPSLVPGQVVNWLARRAFQLRPGAQFSYSNSNYYLLGLVIEHVTGQPYSSYLEDQLLRPLGLSHTGVCPDEMRSPGQAVGYFLSSRLASVTGSYPFASESFAAGELCSTVGDMVEWVNDLASGRVVSPSTYKEMATPAPVRAEPSAPYGYGLMLGSFDGQAWVGHDGATLGFSSLLLHFPGSDLNVAICFNVDPTSASSAQLFRGAENAIAATVVETRARPSSPAPVARARPDAPPSASTSVRQGLLSPWSLP